MKLCKIMANIANVMKWFKKWTKCGLRMNLHVEEWLAKARVKLWIKYWNVLRVRLDQGLENLTNGTDVTDWNVSYVTIVETTKINVSVLANISANIFANLRRSFWLQTQCDSNAKMTSMDAKYTLEKKQWFPTNANVFIELSNVPTLIVQLKYNFTNYSIIWRRKRNYRWPRSIFNNVA